MIIHYSYNANVSNGNIIGLLNLLKSLSKELVILYILINFPIRNEFLDVIFKTYPKITKNTGNCFEKILIYNIYDDLYFNDMSKNINVVKCELYNNK